MVALQLNQIKIAPGQHITLGGISWQDFEAILSELGDENTSRVTYYQGTLEIRMPLPKHEKAKVIIGDIVKILLEELELDAESFGSSTFKSQNALAGIEPDDCFYIQNHQQMIGKDRIDLSVDPPPDLAIEVDITSKTQLDAYFALGVPELWRYISSAETQGGKLIIYVYQKQGYQESTNSRNFPSFPLTTLIPQFIEISQTTGRSQALRQFRQEIRAYQ
jgi:Uma2 family endonuclease